ncbi:acyltransferase [Haloferula helveola]|uniref:Acyltransferase n=1 Tax=Haloferula helveola TaxID=490095 RepID=A0ABN6HAA6_9BACT|nr:acyltransferase [Haloferula helveola]
MAPVLSASRNQELDGWRAIAVLGVMWLHWAIPKWRGGIPFEIGLYFFLTLTGFLITRILLRERDRGDQSGKPWAAEAFRRFQFRRALRILIPCYAAMVFGLIVGAEDIRQHPFVYFAHLSNFHIALLPEWPHGTSHYWTLAIQQQFYLLWPILIFIVPKRALTAVLILLVAVAPISRFVLLHHFPQVHHPGAISLCALDYLASGSLLALAMHRGLAPSDSRLRLAAWGCLAVYSVLYTLDWIGRPVPGLRHVQQTFLCVSMAGLIAATLHGLPRPVAHVLTRPWVLHIAKISYSLYLLHCLVPMALGHVAPFLWEIDGSLGTAVRLICFALAAWGVSWLSWRWIEQPVNQMRSKIPSQ